MPATMDPDRLAELEEERRFLLRSLADLDREHAAGDVDDDDHRVLRDGYTARAATVLRAIEAGTAALPAGRRARPRTVAAWVVAALAVAVLAGWLVARSSGQRIAGQTITGGPELDDVSAGLAEARTLLGAQDLAGAAERFRRVLDLEPANPEARTYTAWILVLSSAGASEDVAVAALERAQADFREVIADDPGYADAHCLYAVTVANFVPVPDLDLARSEAQACLDADPPTGMVELIQPFLAGLGTTVPGTVPGSPAPPTTLG
jgi:hypothetical protein